MAKSETLSETRQKFDRWSLGWHGEPGCFESWQAGRLQGLEEAAKAMCEWCAEGSQADFYKSGWKHAIGSGNLPCMAAAIREKAND